MADQILTDGLGDFLGGQDASKIPDRIPENCFYSGINVSVKRGALRPRWGFERKTLSFIDEGILDKYKRKRLYQEIFEGGKFQALIPYFIGPRQYLLIVVSGFIFILNPLTNNVSTISIEDGSRLNSRARRINWSAAGKFIVLYDFPAYPVLIEGFVARRADPAKMEVPVSTLGAFNENRLYVANNGNEFTGGDPVGSVLTPDAPITFEEVFTTGSPYLGQVFQLPTSDHNDPINFMGFLQSTDASTGVGPLVIGTDRAIYSYATQNPRSSWDQQQFGSTVCYNAGIVGPRAFTNVNSDAFFLAADGFVRSLSQSRDEQHKWARVPISREVENFFIYNDSSLRNLSFVSYFQNKIFFSVNPYRVAVTDFATTLPISDYAFGGMVVLELDNFVSMGDTSKATWAGLWTGIHPMDMVVLGDRSFIIGKDSSFVNILYEVNPEISYDTADTKVRFVRSRIYTKEYDFKDPFQNKRLHSLDINFDNLQGDFSIDVKYKPSHSPYFYPWRTFKHSFPWRTCNIPQSCEINGFEGQHIRDFTIGAPNILECSQVTDDTFDVFRKAQLQITLEGKYFEVHEYRLKAVQVPTSLMENPRLCETLPVIPVCTQCQDDWDTAPFESCKELST